MDKPKYMICNICKKKVRIRKDNAYGYFPVQHLRVDGKDNCHGFFVEGFLSKEGE